MLAPTGSSAAGGGAAPSGVHALLDVPYVSQTPELCGGAAVAMVLRYWGERDVFPEDFAALVGAGAGGILTSVLTSAVAGRGWQAHIVPAVEDAHARILAEVDQGRPLIALIEVGPRTYHYVVIVGATEQAVVVHDPARAPFRVLPWAEFDRASAAADRWMMLVLPPSQFRPAAVASPSLVSGPAVKPAVDAAETRCAALVDRSVDRALSGDWEQAERGLVAASSLCPLDPAGWRELAGLRFSQSRWSEAQDLALAAVHLSSNDAYAWQLVATSRYLMGDSPGALDAWNRAGEPRIDSVDIHGAERTQHPVVARATGWQPRQVLTPEALARARRRLLDLPVAANARVAYRPMAGGLASLDVFIDERPLVPTGWLPLAVLGAWALLEDELRLDVAGGLGQGERASAAWRWSAGRPRLAFTLALPSLQGLPGIVALDASWERQSYQAALPSHDAAPVREERRRVRLRVGHWATSWFHWQTGAAVDRFQQDATPSGEAHVDAGGHLTVDGSLEIRLKGDRVALVASGAWWTPFSGADGFGSGGLLAAWRSTTVTHRPMWSAVTEISGVTRPAPLALWPGAGTGTGRGGLLRAHPLLDGDVVRGSVFGREVSRASLEYARPVEPARVRGLALAAFVDLARARHRRFRLEPSPLHADIGAGIRVQAPGSGGAIRIDVAHGLNGGGTVLSVGWGAAWPR